MPWLVLKEWVRVSTMYMASPKIGIMIPDEEHWEEDAATWSSEPWMGRLKIVMEVGKGRLDQVLRRFRDEHVDLAMNWGYGFGLAPGDDASKQRRIYSELGSIPFVTVQRFAVLHARHLLVPPIDDRRFVGYVKNPPGSPPEA